MHIYMFLQVWYQDAKNNHRLFVHLTNYNNWSKHVLIRSVHSLLRLEIQWLHVVIKLYLLSRSTFVDVNQYTMSCISGTFMARQPQFIPCGYAIATVSLVLKFMIGPVAMLLASLAVGMHGTLLRIAVVQVGARARWLINSFICFLRCARSFITTFLERLAYSLAAMHAAACSSSNGKCVVIDDRTRLCPAVRRSQNMRRCQ